MNSSKNYDTLKVISNNTQEVLIKSELKKKLAENRPLIIKFGCDPTTPNIHLGHFSILKKLKELQNLGHEIHFIIGNFTAQIGDPTGKDKTRPQLDENTVKENYKNYKQQISKILDDKKTIYHFNNQWFDKMNAKDMINTIAQHTVSQMLNREEFSQRYKLGKSIALHEFLYPVMQGYDSTIIKADIELGGTDQKFNLLMGRTMQKHIGQEPQVVITLPILEGLDGKRKMSKSYGNDIAINDTANSMFGKVMSISDNLMWSYYQKLSIASPQQVEHMKENAKRGPQLMDIKITLAKEIVTLFHGDEIAKKSEKYFINTFKKNKIPEEIAAIQIKVGASSVSILYVLKQSHLVSSTLEAIRMVTQGAVRINGEKIKDTNFSILQDTTNIYQIGKRKYAKITLL